MLIALLILSFGVLGMLGLLTTTLKDLRAARLQQRAVDLSTDLTARMRAIGSTAAPGTAELMNRELREWRNRVAASLPGGAVDIVTVAGPGASEHAVTLSWLSAEADGMSHTIHFTTPRRD